MLKVKAHITEEDPCFKVKDIGCIETYVASGRGCTNAPVQKLWDNSCPEKSMKKIKIVINVSGIHILNEDKKKSKGNTVFSIDNISFCNADGDVHERIFSWICKDEASPSLICHAVLCSSREKAKAMALVLSRAFQIAYKEWKMEKTKDQRDAFKEKTKAIEAEAVANNSYPVKYPQRRRKIPEPEPEIISRISSVSSEATNNSSPDESILPQFSDCVETNLNEETKSDSVYSEHSEVDKGSVKSSEKDNGVEVPTASTSNYTEETVNSDVVDATNGYVNSF